MMKAKGKKGEVDNEAIFDGIVAEEEEAKKAAASGKNIPTESPSPSEIPSLPATTECWGKIVKKEQAKVKAKYENDPIWSIGQMFGSVRYDEVKEIFDGIVAEEEEAKETAASGKNISTESLYPSEIPPFPANMVCWGKLQENGKKGEVDYEAIFDGIVAEEEEAKKAAASGKNIPTESPSPSEIPSLPATTECWGKIVKKEQAKVKAKYGNDPIWSIRQMFGSDRYDEFKAIYDSIVAEAEEAKKTAASGKNISTESLYPSEIPPFPANMECWGTLQENGDRLIGEILKRRATMMKAKGKKGEVDDEAAVSGKKRPTESASKTPATEKKAKLISLAGQETGGNRRKGAHTATPHRAKTGKTPTNNDKSKQQTPKSSGSATCKSCNKSFNSDNAFQAHTKAKHSARK